MVRNESLRLPSVLEHCRRLGVERFLVIDNGSDDGTLEHLLAQGDVHVFSTTDSFSRNSVGMDWVNRILDLYADGHWTLTVDADELFIYPHYERVPLAAFCRFLDGVEVRGVFALMLDMYSDKALAETIHAPGAPLLETCAFFESGPYRPIGCDEFPYTRILGGVRDRLFSQTLEGRYRSLTSLRERLVKSEPGSSATDAMSRSRWPRSRCRATCSGASWR